LKTYGINVKPRFLLEFIVEIISNKYHTDIGVTYSECEVFLSSTNGYVLDIIRLKFELIPCEPPTIPADTAQRWKHFGNSKLWLTPKIEKGEGV
jgi:hypothetical protein